MHHRKSSCRGQLWVIFGRLKMSAVSPLTPISDMATRNS